VKRSVHGSMSFGMENGEFHGELVKFGFQFVGNIIHFLPLFLGQIKGIEHCRKGYSHF
jgi:hypothetical protein